MTQIYLIRHGQSANNAQPEQLRVADPGLTETGEQQAAALAAWFAEHPLTSLYCSPFLRSLETTRPLAELKQMSVRVRSDLFELGGCYSGHELGQEKGEPGMGRSQLARAYPSWDIDESISDSGWWNREYESWEQGKTRAVSVERWLACELAQLPGSHLLVIHADFKRLLLSTMLNDSTLAQHNIDLAQVPLVNTGITLLEPIENGWKLIEFNSTEHLPSHWVT